MEKDEFFNVLDQEIEFYEADWLENYSTSRDISIGAEWFSESDQEAYLGQAIYSDKKLKRKLKNKGKGKNEIAVLFIVITNNSKYRILFDGSSANIIDDNADETDETVIVTLSSPSNATLGSDRVHTYTITDDDGPPTIDFNTTSSTGAEDISSVAITVDLSAASSNNISVNYAVTGTATGSGTDYTLADGTLTINAGATSGTITIAGIVDDSSTEGNETVILTLSRNFL